RTRCRGRGRGGCGRRGRGGSCGTSLFLLRVWSGFESVQGVADDRGGLVLGPPAGGHSERVDVGSEREAFLVGDSLDRAMQIEDSLSDGPADGVALAAHHSSPFRSVTGVSWFVREQERESKPRNSEDRQDDVAVHQQHPASGNRNTCGVTFFDLSSKTATGSARSPSSKVRLRSEERRAGSEGGSQTA